MHSRLSPSNHPPAPSRLFLLDRCVAAPSRARCLKTCGGGGGEMGWLRVGGRSGEIVDIAVARSRSKCNECGPSRTRGDNAYVNTVRTRACTRCPVINRGNDITSRRRDHLLNASQTYAKTCMVLVRDFSNSIPSMIPKRLALTLSEPTETRENYSLRLYVETHVGATHLDLITVCRAWKQDIVKKKNQCAITKTITSLAVHLTDNKLSAHDDRRLLGC